MENDYQNYIALSRYARWIPKEGRREVWEETVDRYINFLYLHTKDSTTIKDTDINELYNIIGATCDR